MRCCLVKDVKERSSVDDLLKVVVEISRND